MSTSTHTPGPWRTGDVFNTVFGPPNGQPSPAIVAHVHRGNSANAQLIATAPELLAACERALPWIGKLIANGGHMTSVLRNDVGRTMDMLQSAITKAGGKL